MGRAGCSTGRFALGFSEAALSGCGFAGDRLLTVQTFHSPRPGPRMCAGWELLLCPQWSGSLHCPATCPGLRTHVLRLNSGALSHCPTPPQAWAPPWLLFFLGPSLTLSAFPDLCSHPSFSLFAQRQMWPCRTFQDAFSPWGPLWSNFPLCPLRALSEVQARVEQHGKNQSNWRVWVGMCG